MRVGLRPAAAIADETAESGAVCPSLRTSTFALHAWQMPLTQPSPLGHTLPQEPQLSGSVLMLVSHPFVALLPSQSAYPVEQVPPHTPALQVTVAIWLDEQGRPHPPQLAGLVCTLVSQPSDCLLALQSAKPVAQTPLQTALPQVTVAMLSDEHVTLQPPQLLGSLAIAVSQPFDCLLLSQ